MREWLKVLPLGLGVPIVIGAASVSPDDAVSNISKWIARLGFHDLAIWLSARGADHEVIIWTCMAGALYATTIWILVPAYERWRGREARVGKMIALAGGVICGFGALGFVTSYVWMVVKPKAEATASLSGLHADEQLPGAGVMAIVRLYDSPEFRRRYVFEFVDSEGAKISFYLSASSKFTFSVTDVHGESYPLEVGVGRKGIPIDVPVALFFEVGVNKDTAILQISYNNHQIASRTLPFPLVLGKRQWEAGALGAPVLGINQGGIFTLFEVGTWSQTFGRLTIEKLVENAEQRYAIKFE